MHFDENKLREYLAFYGADAQTWPKNIRALGLRAQSHPEFAALFSEEENFEQLLNIRHIEPAHADFAERILDASLSQKYSDAKPWQAFTYIVPTAFAAMLVLGFAIGFNTLKTIPGGNETMSTRFYSDDEGSML